MPSKLVVEVREGHALAEPLVGGGRILATPDIDEDFWLLRVVLTDRQAIVAFPKFGMLGAGFQVEAGSWNTNLPWSTDAEELYKHILVNKGDPKLRKVKCIQAIELLQRTIYENNFDPERNEMYRNRKARV